MVLDAQAMWIDRKYTPNDTWYHNGKAFRPGHPHYYVGGNTKFYGAALFRFTIGGMKILNIPWG